MRISRDGALHFFFMDWRHIREIQEAARPLFGPARQLCVWVKDNGGMGTFYRSQHELVFVFKRGGAPHINNFELGQHGRYRTNVWTYPGVNTFTGKGHQLLALHPTVKPVGLIADALRDCSDRKGIVLDPFAGSGTILVAAERTGRYARAIELDPQYVDAGVLRWQRVTGKQATLAGTGQPWAQVRAERLATTTRGAAMAYEIGYKCPPKSGQFKPGQSGNPKGRRKGSRNFLTLLEQELGQSIVVNENGKKKVTRLKAMVQAPGRWRTAGGAPGVADADRDSAAHRPFRRHQRLMSLLPDNYEAILDSYVAQRQKDLSPTNSESEKG